MFASNGYPQSTVLLPAGASWRYFDINSDPGGAWASPAFDDSSWQIGSAQLGFGDGDEVTTINESVGGRRASSYFRIKFAVDVAAPDPTYVPGFRLLRDDGAVVAFAVDVTTHVTHWGSMIRIRTGSIFLQS